MWIQAGLQGWNLSTQEPFTYIMHCKVPEGVSTDRFISNGLIQCCLLALMLASQNEHRVVFFP